MSEPTDARPDQPVTISPLPGMPEVRTGTDLAAALVAAAGSAGLGLADGDVLAVSSKLVSKALGLRTPWDGDRTIRDEVVRAATRRVVAERATPDGVTRVVESAAGPVMAAAGVDASNTGPEGGLLSLPEDPDRAADRLRHDLLAVLPHVTRLGVVVTDTAGRPWRAGQTDLALGLSGLVPADDLLGGVDHDGRSLSVTSRALADEIAAAADLVKGKTDGVGAALLRGLGHLVPGPDASGIPGARSLVRTGPGDWFALGHLEAVRAALGATPGSPEAVGVGIRPTALDGAVDRAGRALRLALLDCSSVTADDLVPHHDRVTGTLVCTDRLELGRCLARLEVAVVSEDLALAWTDSPGGAGLTFRELA